MKIIRAKSAGFCLGVSLALEKLDKAIAEGGAGAGAVAEGSGQATQSAARLVVLGAIIHNPLVMHKYEELGVLCLHNPEEVQASDRVVIRAHGIPKEVEEAIRQKGATIIDATCPKVKKAQLAIAKEKKRGGSLLLFGEAEHPEVKGLVSYADHDALVFGSVEELAKITLAPDKKYFLAAQTTQDKKIFLEIQTILQTRLQYTFPVLKTICHATKKRQEEVLSLTSCVDAMVVVGGLNSGNTTRLAQLAQNKGILTLHVETAADLDLSALQHSKIIGLTAGASTPEEHICEVQRLLQGKKQARLKNNVVDESKKV